MEIDNCPKCNSIDVGIFQNYGETTKNGFGIRVQCKSCNFAPPKSKWQWLSAEKAIEIWNKYKRKDQFYGVLCKSMSEQMKALWSMKEVKN